MKEKRHTPIFKPNAVTNLLVVFFIPFLFIAQVVKTSALEKIISTEGIKTLAIESLNTNLVFYPSESTNLEIHAYSESIANNDLNEWELQLNEESNYIHLVSAIRPKQQITSQIFINGNVSNQQLAELLKHQLTPILQSLQNNPIPEVLQSELNQLDFNFEAYNKMGEAYLKIWEQAFVNRLDERDNEEVKQWSQETLPNLIRVSKQSVNNDAVQQVNQGSSQNGGYQVFISKSITSTTNSLADNEYTIEIGVPENISIRLNTRHGNFTAKKELNHIKGNLKYTAFKAEKIGGETDLVIDFAPVEIAIWNKGKLSVNYCKSAKIQTVNQIDLQLNSSKLVIQELKNIGTFTGTFSKLNIEQTSTDFNNLTFLLTQSDLILRLPTSSYNFAYTGNLSLIDYPKDKIKVTSLGDFQSHMLHGYSIDRNTPRQLQINAKYYSQVLLK